MKAITLSTVLLRLAGFYMLYDLFASLVMGLIVQRFMLYLDSSDIMWLGVGLAIKAVLGLVLVFLAPKFSRLLFSGISETGAAAAAFDEETLLRLGLCLLGFYFLLAYLPSLAEFIYNWFRREASPATPPFYTESLRYHPIEPFIMTLLALFLIAKSAPLAAWLTHRHGKPEREEP